MRTSNKLLLGLLAATIFLFTSVFAAVRVKYSRGQVVEDKEVMEDIQQNQRVALQGAVRQVKITALADVIIIPSDSLKLLIWGNGDSAVKYHLQDGMLTIEADTVKTRRNYQEDRAHQHVELFLPGTDSIYVQQSHLVIKNTKDTARITAPFNIQLAASDLAVAKDYQLRTSHFGTFKINASAGSYLHFPQDIIVDEAVISLQDTKFNDEGCVFNKLSLQMDSVSSINIKAQNLRKATITSKE